MVRKIKNNKSQITIFVIIALIIVVVVALIFVLVKKPNITITSTENPQGYIENCLKNSLEKAETQILEGNGYLNITDNYILMSINKPKEKVPYLCKSSEFYKPCINQEPMLIGLIKQEFEKQVKPEAEACFSTLVKELKKKGNTVNEGNMDIQINLYENSIAAEVNKKISVQKDAETRSYEIFVGEINSPIYRLTDTARNIINFESTLCEFNMISWMKVYKDIFISKFVTSDQSKVYTLTDKSSGKKLSFALKTCILPAGI